VMLPVLRFWWKWEGRKSRR